MNSLIYIIMIILGIIIIVYRQKLNNLKSSTYAEIHDAKRLASEEIKTIQSNANKRTLHSSLYQALTQMDSTCNFYTEEDEASRELTTCLNVLGHHAIYHYQLANGRTCDILVDNFIVEGKLDINDQTELDRLIGQVNDYLAYPYDIYIVIYGQFNPSAIERIKSQLINAHPNRIYLIYLQSAKRTRKML